MSSKIVDLDQVALQIGERLRDKATEDGVVPFDTGDLRKSIQVDSAGFGKATVGSNLNYARAVHDGRPAITIRPKKGKALKFTVRGRTVIRKKVHQPARKGKPFLREAAENMNREGYGFLDRYLKPRMTEALQEKIKGSIKLNLSL